jgi:hypothetical protein
LLTSETTRKKGIIIYKNYLKPIANYFLHTKKVPFRVFFTVLDKIGDWVVNLAEGKISLFLPFTEFFLAYLAIFISF